jgi:hypothetical protein
VDGDGGRKRTCSVETSSNWAAPSCATTLLANNLSISLPLELQTITPSKSATLYRMRTCANASAYAKPRPGVLLRAISTSSAAISLPGLFELVKSPRSLNMLG